MRLVVAGVDRALEPAGGVVALFDLGAVGEAGEEEPAGEVVHELGRAAGAIADEGAAPLGVVRGCFQGAVRVVDARLAAEVVVGEGRAPAERVDGRGDLAERVVLGRGELSRRARCSRAAGRRRRRRSG